jgi:hypothetical protein
VSSAQLTKIVDLARAAGDDAQLAHYTRALDAARAAGR